MLGVVNTLHSGSNAHATDGGDNFLCNLPTSQQPSRDVDDMSQDIGFEITKNNERINFHLDLIEGSLNRDIEQTDEVGCTSLYKAASRGRWSRVINLVESGADPNTENEDGRRALHVAAEKGYEDIVKFLVDQEADVNAEDYLGQTALHVVMHNDQCISAVTVGMGHLNIVKYLIEKGSKIGKQDHRGYTPFHIAAANGHLEIVKYLIDQKCSVKEFDNKGLSPLALAARHGHLDTVKYLADGGVDEMVSLYGAALSGHSDIVRFFMNRTSLHLAASDDDLDNVQYLVQQGFDINSCDEIGWTPLEYAIQNNNCEVIDYLLTNGAKANQCKEESPLYMASRLGHLDAVTVLISREISVNAESHRGQIPLHAAAATGRIQVVEILIENGSDLNKTDIDGWTPLQAAVQNGHLEVVKYLMWKGAINMNFKGMTSLHIAAQNGHFDIVKHLNHRDANLNDEDDLGRIPLHSAAMKGDIELVHYLVEQGSDVNKGDSDGWTPMHEALQSGNLFIVQYLLEKGAKLTKFRGRTPLSIASSAGHLDIVDLLLSNGADVNEENATGRIPLHAAAANSSLEIVEKLINLGSNVNKMADNGWTQLHAAAYGAGLNVVRFLISRGATETRFEGMTVLYNAAQRGHIDLINYFVNTGCDVNDATDGGKTPHLAACYNGDMNSVEMLVTQGACINQADRNEWTPVHAAAKEGHLSVVTYLVENGADTNAKDRDGITPLQAAEDGGLEDVKQFLFRLREEVQNERHNDTDKTEGMTPFQAAEDAGHQDVQKCLIQSRTEVHDGRYDDTDKSFRFNGNCPEVFRGSGMLKVPAWDRLSGINSESYYPMPLIALNVTTASIPMQDSWPDTLPRHIKTTIRHSRLSYISKSSTQLHHVHRGEVPTTGDFLITDENGAVDPKPGTKSEHQNNAYCFSTLGLLHRAILALVFYFACFPILVAGNLNLMEPVTLVAGTRGVVTFYLERPISTLQFSLFYTIQFESKRRPFCIDGQYDIDGFKDPAQVSRFTTTVIERDTSPCVNMTIDNVDTLDEDRYIFIGVYWNSPENVLYDTQKKEVVVHRPPGPADCFITLSDSEYPYKVHCWAKTGSMPTTLTCYQNDRDLVKVHNITDNGHTTRAIFFLPDTTRYSCCSHDITSTVGAATCNDFEWPPGYSGIPSTEKTTRRSRSAGEQSNRPTDPTFLTYITSDVGSGACRSSIIPSQWHFLYLLIYLHAFVIMC